MNQLFFTILKMSCLLACMILFFILIKLLIKDSLKWVSSGQDNARKRINCFPNDRKLKVSIVFICFIMVNGQLYFALGKELYINVRNSYFEGNPVVLIPNKWMLFESDIRTYPLDFSKTDYTNIEKLSLNNIKIVEEKIIDKNLSVFIFTSHETDDYSGAICVNDNAYTLGQISMKIKQEDLMAIEDVQIFGKRAVKLYGILGVNDAQSYYWLFDEKNDIKIVHVEGNAVEIDLDKDDKNEIVSTMGTVPETRIYKFEKGHIYVSNINQSIGAKSVYLKDVTEKVFEVHFVPNVSEQYIFSNDTLIKN